MNSTTSNVFLTIFPVFFVIIFLIILVLLLQKRYRAKVEIPLMILSGGFSVPVYNAYVGYILFNIHNGLYPSLVLFEDHLEFRVVTKKSYRFDQIKQVDGVSGSWNMGTSLTLSFNDGSWNYRAFMNEYNLKQVLLFLSRKNCKLTERAYALINT